MRHEKTFGPPSDATVERVTKAQFPPASYESRDGYRSDFLHTDEKLPLPGPGRWEHDRLPLADGPEAGSFELRYTHFSVEMAKSRELPLFSACNIEGKLSDRSVVRTNIWRRDSRIEGRYQNLSRGYGNENQGLFSRGHMTRREDPNWGDRATAEQADADTFHITNVVPQRQGFNAGIWLDLENYVLDNTDDNDLRVSVITGPVMRDEDPEYYDGKVPTEFWKIVAFVHYVTKQLTTIGYLRSQLTYLPKLQRTRFVFGDFEDTQVSIASLMQSTGLDLSHFAEHDVMAQADPALEVRLSAASDVYLRS